MLCLLPQKEKLLSKFDVVSPPVSMKATLPSQLINSLRNRGLQPLFRAAVLTVQKPLKIINGKHDTVIKM